MKTLAIMFLTGAAFVAASPALAGRDLSQIIEQERAVKARQAEQLAQAKEKGLAGATGVPGKIGPGTQPTNARRTPGTHP